MKTPALLLTLFALAACPQNLALTQAGGYALRFDGVDDFVRLPDSVILLCMYQTFEAWFHTVDVLPADFTLGQNYPNPFNPTTSIEFRIQNSERTILEVFNLLGRRVATLVNEVKEPGTYTVKWDAAGFASGVYFYRLKTGDFVQMRRCSYCAECGGGGKREWVSNFPPPMDDPQSMSGGIVPAPPRGGMRWPIFALPGHGRKIHEGVLTCFARPHRRIHHEDQCAYTVAPRSDGSCSAGHREL